MRSNNIMSEQPNNKNIIDTSNNNLNNNEGSGNSSSITTTASAKKGKNKSNGSSSSNNNSNSNSNNNNSEKPKQPQRGLGVAQLEKIRLHSQMASVGLLPPPPPLPPSHHHPAAFLNPSFQPVPNEVMRFQVGYPVSAPPLPPPPPPFCFPSPPVSSYHHPNAFMIGVADQMERTNNIRFIESQPFNSPRWNPSTSYRAMPEVQPYPEPPGMVTRHLLSHVEQHNGMSNLFEPSSSIQPYESGENQELDLELRL